jgi:hypothetical protein
MIDFCSFTQQSNSKALVTLKFSIASTSLVTLLCVRMTIRQLLVDSEQSIKFKFVRPVRYDPPIMNLDYLNESSVYSTMCGL